MTKTAAQKARRKAAKLAKVSNLNKAKTQPKKTEMKAVVRAAEKAAKKFSRPPPRSQPKRQSMQGKDVVNALASSYVAASLRPDIYAPARYPDADPVASSVCKSLNRYPVALTLDTGLDQRIGGFAIFPGPKSCIYYVSASATGALTWTLLGDDPQYAFLLANSVRCRCNAMAGWMADFSPQIYLGGTLYCGQIQPSTYNFNFNPGLPATISAIAAIQTVEMVRLSADLPKHSYVTYQPMDESCHLFRRPDDTGNESDWDQTWNTPQIWLCVLDAAGVVNLNLTVTRHFEFQAIGTSQLALNSKTVVGNPGIVGNILAEINATESGRAALHDPQIIDFTAKDRMAYAADWLTRAGHTIHMGYQLVSEAVSAVTGLFSYDGFDEVKHFRFVADHLEQRKAYLKTKPTFEQVIEDAKEQRNSDKEATTVNANVSPTEHRKVTNQNDGLDERKSTKITSPRK